MLSCRKPRWANLSPKLFRLTYYPASTGPFSEKLFGVKSNLKGTKREHHKFAPLSRSDNVQNLFYVFCHQRQMALARVKGSVVVWNGCGQVVPHGGRRIGIRLAMPKVDCGPDVLGAEIPRASHEGRI